VRVTCTGAPAQPTQVTSTHARGVAEKAPTFNWVGRPEVSCFTAVETMRRLHRWRRPSRRLMATATVTHAFRSLGTWRLSVRTKPRGSTWPGGSATAWPTTAHASQGKLGCGQGQGGKSRSNWSVSRNRRGFMFLLASRRLPAVSAQSPAWREPAGGFSNRESPRADSDAGS
jgi:hypothetical protein